jgi:hypothetical protein
MDITFKELTNKIIVIYLDDLRVFSRLKDDHFDHLEMVFQKCQEFGISLNPKKCIFRLPQRKLLGHVVSKYGVAIDPDKVIVIKDLPLLVNKKGVQSFLGKVNFVSKFMSNFAGMARPITLMLKKDQFFKWTREPRVAFKKTKKIC